MSKNSWVIWDKELENLLVNWQDKLGTTKYVNQLFEIITNLSDEELKWWFNIGLYWWWWSGKSSIARALETKIKNECNNKFWIIYFDCWKYSNDDLRRCILLWVAGEYKNDKLINEIDKLFYADRWTKIEENSKYDLERIKENRVLVVFIFLILWFIVFCKLKWPEFWSNSVFEIFWVLAVVLLSLLEVFDIFENKFRIPKLLKDFILKINKIWINDIKNFLPTLNISHSITEWKIFSWEQFENIFQILIRRKIWQNQFKDIYSLIKDSDNLKNEKILFIFDNIDRCESDTMKEILMTIKTFLNQDNCVFLLPIDYENICKSYKNYDQWKEYLRKIFNLWIQLERPRYDNLWNLVEQTILQNERKKFFSITESEISEIAYILSLVFSDNPRKIKQFLNNLWAECLLYNENNPTNKIDMCLLTKKLIIQQEIPELYDILLKNRRNYEEFIWQLEAYAWKYEEYYEDYSKNNKEKIWDNYPIFVVFKQLKRLDEREIQIINHLSEIHWDFLNIWDYKKVLSDLVDNQQYEDFKNKIKKDKLENQAKLLFEEYSKQIWKSKFNDKKYIIWYIYFYIFSSQDNKLLWKIFTKTERPYFESVLIDLNIEDNIFFKFIELLKIEDIKRMWKWWISELFTRKIFKDEKNLNIVKKYKKEEKKLELLINQTLISQYVNFEIKNENIESSTIYKFLESNEKFIPDRLLSEGDIPNRIDNCPIDVMNKIKILSLWNKYGAFSERIKILLDNSQRYTVQWNTNFMKNYVLLSSVFLKTNIIDDNIKNILINIYASYDIQKEKIIKIFYDYVYYKKANDWENLSDTILDQRMKNVIECMIKRTNEENWLNSTQLNRIYREYAWDREENKWIIIALRNNKKWKDVIIRNMQNETLNTIKSKIEFINWYRKILIKDKEIFWNIIYEKIKNILWKKDKVSIEELSKFLNENIEFKDYILKHDKKEIINILNDYKFPPEDKEWPYYEERIREIINILK